MWFGTDKSIMVERGLGLAGIFDWSSSACVRKVGWRWLFNWSMLLPPTVILDLVLVLPCFDSSFFSQNIFLPGRQDWAALKETRPATTIKLSGYYGDVVDEPPPMHHPKGKRKDPHDT